jgi:hemerythrin-like metal-binding protein
MLNALTKWNIIMDKHRPVRQVDSAIISAQHSRIIEEIETLTAVTEGGSIEAMQHHFDILGNLIREHFECEESILKELEHHALADQQKEHAMLSRMIGNMRLLMEASGTLRWRTTVIDATIDALVLHFAKEDDEFSTVANGRRRQ